MNMKSAFLYGKIDEEVYISQSLGFTDPKFPNKVYKVVKALYGLHQAPKAHVTIFNTIDHLGKFEEKSAEGFLVGYSLSSKAFRVYNLETKRVEENLHIKFLENKPNFAGKGPTWLFDLDYLTDSMNYQPITAKNIANHTVGSKETNNSAGTQDSFNAGNSEMEADHAQEYYVLPLWSSFTLTIKISKAKNRDEKINEDTDSKTNEELVDQEDQAFLEELERLKRQEKEANDTAETLRMTFAQINAASTPLNTASTPTNQDDSQIPAFEDIYNHSSDMIFTSVSYDDEGAVADFINLKTTENGYRQEERVDYDEVFSSVARIEAIRIFLAFASYMGFIVYQMNMKSAFLYGKIDEEVYVSQPLGFTDPKFPNKVYKVVKALYGLHQAPKAWFQVSSMGELTFFLGLQVKQKKDGIFISQDKYVAEILKKFDFLSVKTANTRIETKKPLVKDEEAADVNVHLYRSMNGSLMYLTASRADIMYLKGQPKLGLWYPRESDFDLEAYSDSDYTGANLDKKSITGATSTTEAEYVAAASCCGQVLWIQNQMFNFLIVNIRFLNL
nr:ribonuclease H-like domain, reverse transcriptase, RNA-dependent DNA polymerase [Tanacetum cinerariifolium]